MTWFEELYDKLQADGQMDSSTSFDVFLKKLQAQGEKGYQYRKAVFDRAKDLRRLQKQGYQTQDYSNLGVDEPDTYETWWRARSAGYQQQKRMKDKVRENSPVARQPKPAATPQGQKPKPVQQPTPNKPDSVSQQYMPKDIPDPTKATGQSRVRPQQGTGVLKRDAQIMADDSLSAEDKVALINENRRRRGQQERSFGGPAYEETALNAGVTDVVPNPVEGFTDDWNEAHEAYNTPSPVFYDREGNPIGYKEQNYVNKSVGTLYEEEQAARIKEIADEINYYNTKQDQGGGGTTRIEDAINSAYDRFVKADAERTGGSFWNQFSRALAMTENAGIVQDAVERGALREKYAGLDAVAEAAYNSFPDEVKQKYGEDAVYSAIYQATLSAMQENARPKNYGEYLAQKLISTVPAILYKAAVRANAGGRTTLSDIADMETAKYEQELDKQGFGGQVMHGIGTGVSFVADPTMYIPFGGGAGNLVGRAIASTAAKQAVVRGLEAGAVKLASKAAGSKIISRGLVRGVSGGVQMAAYQEALGLANMANGSGQNFWEVTGEALETGAIMVPLGFVSQGARVVKGRAATAIADKGLSRGTQWVANTGAKLGINTTAFIAEAGIFASPDLIKMAVNGTYTNEQARDVVNHSIASLAGIKVAGAFNPTHIEQTMQQVRSVVKGTMGTELALDRHDSEALERLGYPKIQGDNIMSLFIPLGERPQAKEGGGYFSMYSQIVLDERVPWSTRAKLIYVATGMLPETGVRPNRVKYTTDENGRIVVTTFQGNNPISQRFFDKKHEASARSYHRKVDHDVERMLYEGAKQDIITENTGGMGRSKLLNDALAKKPSERTPAEMSLIDAYEASVREAMEIAEMARDIAMQGGLPDPEKALKKSKFDRTEEEKSSVERYWRYLNRYIDELRRDNYEPIARDMAQRSSEEAAEEMSNTDGKLYLCQLRDEPADTWYTVVDFDGTIERDETGMRINLGPNGDKMMVRNMATGETKLVSRNDIVQIGLDEREGVRSWLEEQMFANTLNSLVDNRRRASMYPPQPQVAEEGERLTLAADNVDPTTGLRPEYEVIDKDGKSGTYIVEDAQGNRKLINGHDILQKITDAEPQIPTQIAHQVPPTGPQTPPPAAPAQEPPVQQQGEAPAMPEQGDVFKLKVGDEFKDAEVIGKDDTGIIARYEDNGMFRTEHLTPEELAPRLEQQEAPAAPATPPAQGEGGAPAAPENGIPEDENGNKLFHKAEPKAVEDYFKNEKGYDDRFILAIADKRIAEAQKDLADAAAKREKAYADVDEQAMDEAIAAERDAQERLDWWNTFKEGYGKEEPAGEQPPVVEGGGQPPVQEGEGGEQPPVAEGGEEPDVPRDWHDDVPAEARKRGYIMDGAGGKIMRQDPFEEPKGNTTQVNFGGKTGVVEARYDIVEAETVQESHVNGQENPLHFFIREAQPKERTDRASQRAANATANNIRPVEITSGATAYSGAPVVNARREVIQGNGRENALHNAYANGTAEEYRQYLIDHAEEWGLDPEVVRNMRRPQLVRVIDVPDERAIELGLMDDKDIGTGGKQFVDPKTLIAKIDTDLFNRLMQAAFEGMKEDDSFADALRQNGKNILDLLIANNLINETQLQGLMNADGTLTKDGRNTLTEMVLMPLFDGAPASLRPKWDSPAIPERAKTALIRTLGRLSRIEDKSVIEDIRKAVSLLYEMRDVRDANTWKKFVHRFNEWGGQVDIQHPEPIGKDYTPEQVRMAGAIKFVAQNKLTGFFGDIYSKMFQEPGTIRYEPVLPKPEAYKEAFDAISDILTPEEIKDFSAKPEGSQAEQGERPAGSSGRGEGPATPPTTPAEPETPQEPQGGGEPPKPEEPGRPAGEPAGGPATPPSGERHQLTVDEINGLNLSQSTKENAIDYVNGDRGPRATNAYETALKEWERVNGKSDEGKTETPPAAPEGNGPQEPPRGGGRRSAPKSGGGKPAEPKPAEPKSEGEGPKDNGVLDFSGLDELGEFEGLFGDSDVNESRRPAREDGSVSDTNEARYIPNKATAEQNRAVEKVVEVLAGIGKQLLEKRGMRTQSELVDFMRRNDEAKKIREALDKIGFDDEDKSNLFDDMWGQRVDTPWEAPRNRMRLSEYADELSKADKPKQDDKPKQIVSPMEPTVKNIVYQPNSKGKTNESIIPASMAQAVKTALGKINGGDTDGFVMDKVGFKDKDELYGALNAEQIDGVALAISAIERGEGLILGDMTGIGKGRQLAAVIRYARKEGIRPVFVTEKPGLFKDMMRDLLDVGADTPNKPFRPLILASAGNGDVTLADGSTVKAADAETIEKLLSGDLDKLAKGYDALFVTYANTNNVESAAFIADQEARRKTKTHNENTETREPPELTKKKLNLIAKWARGSIVVMDEAHNAAGTDSNQAVQWREIIDTKSGVNAKGVVMASATYAKTPKNYVLYALRTPIKEAHLSNNQLEEVFAKGGVPLQEWLAGQLTGESYIRRERDMTGVNFDYRICVDGYDAEHPENSTPEALEKVKAIRKSNDQAAKIANTLLALDNLANEEFKKIKDALAPSEKSGKAPMAVTVLVQQADGTYKEQTIDPRNYGEKLKVTTSSFASQIAGVNAQLFMAEKADSAADAAIAALENGELPMIVFENTFDSLMEEIPVDERGVLESADYAQAFVRYLDRLGNFKVKLPKYNANGAQEVYNCRIDLSSNPDFVRVKRMIENEGVGLHVSPVDRIRERLEAAGYKVGELSGRKNSIQKLADGKYHKVKRKTEDPDKITDDYNTGKIDVLLINASGSTGRSMHEKGTWSEDGKEKIPGTTQSGEKILMKPRHQIYVQNFSNETTMVQAMGRIDRTGQVEHGLYTFLMTPVPAETNILMRAQRKREQLKANTTAQQDRNSFDAVNASDFINKYGDEVVAEYLEDNPRTLSALQLKKEDLREGTGKAKSGLAKKATANAYTLTCEQQQEFYDEVQAAYDEYVRVLKENGDYDLETQVADLQAETIAEHMFVRGSHESDSMFSQDTNIARCRVKILRRPLKVEDIDKHVNEVTGTDKDSEHQEKYQEKFDKHFADMEAEVEKEFEGKEQNVENDGKKNDKLGKIRAFKLEAQRVVNDFPLGLLMPFFSDTSEAAGGQGKIVTESMPHAIVYDVKLGRTLNSSTIIFAVNDGRQKVAVRMNDDATLKYLRRLQITPGEKFDRSEWNKSQGDSYEDAFIITGNLIGAYHSPIASRGRMIRYTDNEGNVHTGILMPRNFKTKDVVVDKPISEFANQLMQFAKYGPSTISLPVFAKGELEAEETRYSNVVRFVAKGELAKRFAGDTDLATYRTGKTTNKYEVTGRDSLQKVLGIFAGRYGVSASVPIDPAHFMTREERDKEAESRMFRVNEDIEETAPSTRSRYYNTPFVVHVPKERRKNVDATSDWLDKIIEKLNDNGYYGNYDTLRTIEGGRRVYSEFHFQNKKMAEEFIKMVNEEPVRPLAVDEVVEAAEPHWEEVDRSQHTYHIAGESEPLIGDDIASTFGFRNVDTGSLGHDGIRDLYNAFMTMAMILNIHPKSISLGGNMDMNMLDPGAAAREMGDGVTAHFRVSGKANSYTGGTQKKMQFRAGESAFPLAHEWLHALDNYFGTYGLKNEETGFYEQARRATESADRPNRPWTAREEMREAWYGLIRSLVESGFYGRLENEHFFKGSNFTDSSNRPMYWGKRTEMLARAFEAYMRKKITENEDNLRIVTGNSTTGREPTPSDNYVVLNNRPTMFYSIDGHLEYESEIRKYCNAHGIQFDGVENALLDITGREGGYGLPTNADSIKRLKAYLGEDRAIDLLKSIGIDGEVRMDGLFYSFDGESSSIAQRMRDMIADGSINTSGEFDPTPKEQAVIDKAFDKFFETIREKRDVDTGRVIMYEQAKPGETKRESTMRETRNLNRVLARTGLANSVTVESERDFAEGVFASTGRPLRTLDGIVYGYTDREGNIHLNAKYLNFETPIHEYGHLWTAWAKKNHGDLWQRGIELAKESDAFKRLKEESKKKGSVYNGMTDDQLADEVLADAIGKKGQDMYDPKDWTRTARVRHWLTQLWHRIGEALGFRKRMPNMAVGDMSFDDIIRTAAGDILSGKRLKGAKGKGKVNFASKGSVPTFYSNAARAVENVKQNKATAEQWKAMLTKQGGIKAGEDKWMGLSEWLDEHKGQTLTKEEVAQFVADNGIKMEETHYGDIDSHPRLKELQQEYNEVRLQKQHELDGFVKRYDAFADEMTKKYGTKAWEPLLVGEDRSRYRKLDDWRNVFASVEHAAFEEMVNRYGADFRNGFHAFRDKLLPYYRSHDVPNSSAEAILGNDFNYRASIRRKYATDGLEKNREIAFVVPDVEPYKGSDSTHFGPENKGRAVMWVRFGETTDADGNRVLVIDEVQSNRHQDAREVVGKDENGKPIRKGYKSNDIQKRLNNAHSEWIEAVKIQDNFEKNMAVIYGTESWYMKASKEELDEWRRLVDYEREHREAYDEALKESESQEGKIPAAPFETNWHEVVMKRMLRLAAEEGFDKVAWTTGKQQNDRYDLATYISKIEKERRDASTLTVDLTVRDTNGLISFDVDKDGIITHSYQNKYSETVGKPLADVIGKEVADEVLHSNKRTFNMDEMEIGGEGMKVFYDQMLPQYMGKYGKKWGVKVGEVQLSTPGKEVMHSVDITPEMRESVITQGQPLFQQGRNEQIDRYPNGEIKEVRNYDDDGNLRRLLRYDENGQLVRHYQTDIGTDWTRDENGVARGRSNGVEMKPYNFRFQQAPANNPAGSQQGNNEQLHIAREYAQDRTRANTRLYEEMVENTVSLRHVLEDIARKSGKPIADYENVYLAENQSHGMMTTELITFRDRRVHPLLDQLRKLAKNYGGEPTKNYVWARHGIERSIYICFRERAYELAEAEAEAAARARGEEVTDQDINDAYNAMLDELYNATSAYSRRAYLENLETECSNILSAHGDKEPFEVTDKAGLTALNDKRSLVDDKPIENAWEIVKEYENNAGTEGEADIEALFDRLNDISKSMLDYSRDKGMMDKATVEKIRKMFRFYVPLQGFAEGTMAQDYFEYVDSNPMRAGRAVPNTPKMRGRTGESADPIATLVRNAEMTIAAARRNTVATHLYNLATSRDTDLFAPARAWEAYDAAEDTWVPSTPDFTGCETTKDMMDAIRLHDEQMRQQRELGLAREARRGFSNRLVTAQGAPKGLKMSMRQRHEHAVPVRINGKENVIYALSDPRIAQIVNGTDLGRVDKDNAAFLHAMARLTRFRAGLMTSYSIPFWFRNGVRDIQNAFLRQAIMNGGSSAARTAVQGLKGDPFGVIPWEAYRLYSKAVKGTLDESNKHERYFKEFFEHGGITGYAFAEQAEKIQSRVKKLLKHPNRSGRRLMFAVGEWLEKGGGAFEIAPRFAAYVASRDGGKSIMQSVSDAKEATVNFDRRGARRSWLMRTVAALYAFHNPGVQGMQNRLHMWRTKPTKTSILHAAGFVMGHMWKAIAVAMLIAWNRKEDEYDTQLTEHDRRNNLCFPVGDDDWVKIPINMEDRVMFGLGDAVRDNLDVFNGNRYFGGKEKSEYDDEGSDLLEYMKLISAWFPIDPASENNWVPTNVQPFYDVYVNHKDYRGQAVDWRSDRDAQEPEYKRINPSMTSKMWVNASKWWSEKGGGTSVRRAKDEWHEINPQHMQYLFQSFLGGLGSTLGQAESLLETMTSDDKDVKWNSFKFPIASSFWKGNLSEYSSTKDERKKSSVWCNWAEEVIRVDREYRKRGAEHDGEDNKLTDRDKEDYEDNLRYLELAKRIHSLADKKSQAKKKATKEGRMLTEDEESEIDNAFNENIPDFEQEFVKIDGKRKAPDFRKHYDDD